MKQIRRKENFMDKTINEKLFEQLMRAPHAIRKAAIDADFREGIPEGSHGHGPHGHGPEHDRDHRHEGHGPMHGHGPMDDYSPEGPHREGHGPDHRPMGRPGPNPAFARERVLDVIGRFEDGVRQKTLTEELRINPSSVSEMISKLENDGYVKRTVDPTDKRATLITLTELGEARTAELSDERNERLDRAFGNLTDAEKEQLIALLEKLTEAK